MVLSFIDGLWLNGVGRDGLTHNMLDLIHSHWKRQRVCKVRCKGVPTVDMDNVCHHLEVFDSNTISKFSILNVCEAHNNSPGISYMDLIETYFPMGKPS